MHVSCLDLGVPSQLCCAQNLKLPQSDYRRDEGLLELPGGWEVE